MDQERGVEGDFTEILPHRPQETFYKWLPISFPLRAPLALSVGIGFMSGAQIDWNSPEARTLFQSRVACSSPGIRHYRRSKAYPCLSSAFASDQLCDLWQII